MTIRFTRLLKRAHLHDKTSGIRLQLYIYIVILAYENDCMLSPCTMRVYQFMVKVEMQGRNLRGYGGAPPTPKKYESSGLAGQ